MQNEADAVQIWESCVFKPEDEVDFVTNYLYPAFEKNNIKTKILVYDHNKENLFNRAMAEFNTPEMRKAASGIAFHWYSGNHFENIALCREKFPEMLLFHTEGCFGFNPNYSFHNHYGYDIAEDLYAGTNAYLDWNMLLNSKGGPCHKPNYCNSPVFLTPEETDYRKTLAYYYIGHYSKVIQPGALRIGYSRYSIDLKMTAFKNPDGSIAIVLLNQEDTDMPYRVFIGDVVLKGILDKQSIVSFLVKE